MPQPNSELRVFISSTFRDLQEEREHQVKKIFPEIRALCRQRGITFTEVDLRWGLTEEDVVLGQVIRTCLEEIDRCRPYFIGITGERYGYVPDLVDIYKDAELIGRYPWIEDAVMEGASIIDLEFRHSALNDGNDRARFFFRRTRYGEESAITGSEQAALERLQQRVREAGLPVEEFRDPVSLGEMVYDELRRTIDRDYADAVAPTALEQERIRHEAFAASRRRAYIPNPEYLSELSAWYQDAGAPPLILYAESGSGKSSLVSFWCQQQKRREPESFIVEHYVGIGAGDSDHLGIIRHVIEEIRERYERSEEIPSKPEEMERDFANWLGFGVGAPMLLVIDGINQLTGRALDLHWLPPMMPAGVKLIITSTVEQTLVDLRRRGWRELAMQPLKEREREGVIVRYLSEYHKALSKEQVTRIVEDAKCSHPLFLRTLLEELRLDSSHEKLDERIGQYLRTSGTEDLFQRVLERLEDDYSQKVVREVMSLLWCSRGGLSEEELGELTGVGRLKLSTLLLGLDYHLVRREGVLTFFHDYLRRAVEKRYLTDAGKKRQGYAELANYFEGSAVGLRATRELLHALENLGERARLEAALTEMERFEEIWAAESEEVLRLWSSVDVAAVAAAYDAGVERCAERERREADRRAAVLGSVADLLNRIGAWVDAERLQRERVELLREVGDRAGESQALSSLMQLTRNLGRMEESERLAREAEEMARELGDRRSIAVAVGNRGNVHSIRGEYSEALACYGEHEEMARELGDRRSIAIAVGNRGNGHRSRGEYSEALACYAESEAIARELGDRRSIAVAVGNRGNVHWSRGEYSEALACYGESEAIARELGDRSSIAVAVGNRGNVHWSRGEYSEALACYGESEAIARELGDRSSIARAMGHRGLVHWSRGEYNEALACYAEQEAIARELGDRSSIAHAMGNRGIVHRSRGEYSKALACYAEWEAIARELGDRRSIALAVGNRGIVHSSRGEYSEALACYQQAATEHGEIGYRDGLTNWLSGTAHVLVELVEQEGELPEYLGEYVPDAEGGTWQAMSLRVAREQAEECVSISEELSKADTLFNGRILLARIEAAEGRRDVALQRLTGLLEEATTPTPALEDSGHPSEERMGQCAELHYRLWKLSATDADHRSEAEQLYAALFERIPKHDYRVKLEELRAARSTPSPEADDAVVE